MHNLGREEQQPTDVPAPGGDQALEAAEGSPLNVWLVGQRVSAAQRRGCRSARSRTPLPPKLKPVRVGAGAVATVLASDRVDQRGDRADVARGRGVGVGHGRAGVRGGVRRVAGELRQAAERLRSTEGLTR